MMFAKNLEYGHQQVKKTQNFRTNIYFTYQTIEMITQNMLLSPNDHLREKIEIVMSYS